MRQFQPPPGHTRYPHWPPPQNPPQPGINSTPQQSFPSQQFRHMLSGLPQRRPQTPRRKQRKRLSLAVLIVVVIVAAFIVTTFIHDSQPISTPKPITQTTHPTSEPTSASTLMLASQATSQPTTKAIPTAAIIGSDIAQFMAIYGQPNNRSISSAGYYHFRRYASSDLDFLIVQTDTADGGIYAQRVKGVMAQAPGRGWNQQEAIAACNAFLPRDALYERTVKLADGYDKVFFSASIAGLFRASSFTDPNGNQVKAGLFDVQYIYRSETIIDSCGILIGTQQTQL